MLNYLHTAIDKQVSAVNRGTSALRSTLLRCGRKSHSDAAF
jgi:hypothetical protein